MDSISIRYGQTVTLPLDTSDLTAISADIFVGNPGTTYILTKHIDLVDGVGTFVFSTTDTEIPLGNYKYQINTTDSTGNISKYPSPQVGCGDCDDDFPDFIVCEALDVNEVS